MNVIRFFHTVRYLKKIQIKQRFLNIFKNISLFQGEVENRRETIMEWGEGLRRPQTFFCGNKSTFLNETGKTNSWDNQSKSKLWLYNLHYFEDLNAEESSNRREMQQQIVNSWIDVNAPLTGNGWEPYVISLRVVNWVKAFLNGFMQTEKMDRSLFQQAHVLSQSIEYHLLGNHLFSNGKSLVFCGIYFSGEKGNEWLREGLNIVDSEIPEQILEDGGYFELSTMYHNIILADILDLIKLSEVYSHPELHKRASGWRVVASKMLYWMRLMTMPDGKIGFFNDASFGVACESKELLIYADSVAVDLPTIKSESLTVLSDSGYSVIEKPRYKIIFDHGKVGPDYLPAHAHADSLSLEWSVGTQRVLVNSGTSMYGLSDERLQQRGTAAHNTVVVDGENSSEVWSGFRVARRAYATVSEAFEAEDAVKVSASHDGYQRLKGKVTHTRSIVAEESGIQITDRLSGKWSSAVAMYHLHPDIKVGVITDYSVQLSLPDKRVVLVESTGKIILSDGFWYPEFGLSISNKNLKIIMNDSELTTSFLLA